MASSEPRPPRRLRVLCVHGFRQSASSFRGRSAALQRKLRHLAELHFVDGPYLILPPTLTPRDQPQPGGTEKDAVSTDTQNDSSSTEPPCDRQGMLGSGRERAPRYAWLVGPTVRFEVAPHAAPLLPLLEGSGTPSLTAGSPSLRPSTVPRVAATSQCREDTEAGYSDSGHRDTGYRDTGHEGPLFDPSQFKSQSEGLPLSLRLLRSCLEDEGPFDGVLGFSQGAAVVAALALHDALHGQPGATPSSRQADGSGMPEPAHRAQPTAQGGPASTAGTGIGGSTELVQKPMFYILCSGFLPSSLSDTVGADQNRGTIGTPSLHIYGWKQGADRQIACRESETLASLFRPGTMQRLTHEYGHIIPVETSCIKEIKDFLLRFM